MKTGLSSRCRSIRRLPVRADHHQYGIPDHYTAAATLEVKVKKVFVQSFGCRASQADGASIESSLHGIGYARASTPADADLLIVNTCTVTHGADVDARRYLRGLHRDHPSAEILVTGCYAQRAPAELAQIEGVRWVVGNSHKPAIASIVETPRENYHGQILVSPIPADFRSDPVLDTREDRTRPNLKVQDGCGNRCSFCIIPSVRGRSRSAPLESILSQIENLAARYCEVVLSGINLGRWGRDLPGQFRFVHLLQHILARTPVRRLRISSVEPMDWSADLLHLMAADERIAKHMHIPLQSGSDAVLKRMYRKYRTRHYAARLALATRLMPDAAIGADVMTGFPGETDADFSETVQFIESQPFTYLHVFTYSERPGTEAAALPSPVPVELRRERTALLRQLSDRKNLDFRRRMLGKTLPSVTLEQPGLALSTNFLKVQLAGIHEPNRMLDLEIASLTENGLREKALLPVL